MRWDAFSRCSERWLEHDPVRLAGDIDEAVRVVARRLARRGPRDEYFLDLGASALRDALLARRAPDDRLHFELVDGRPRRREPPLPALARLARRAVAQLSIGSNRSMTFAFGTSNPNLR